MTTKDLDGYAGYGDFGQGDRLVMSLGHLDVVPVGPGWKHEPFGAEIDEGYIYALAALRTTRAQRWLPSTPMRAIKEVCPNVPRANAPGLRM